MVKRTTTFYRILIHNNLALIINALWVISKCIKQKHSRKDKTSIDVELKEGIDLARAKEVARLFLQQLHTTVIFEEAVLKGNVWTVTMDVGLVGKHFINVKVDAYTGLVLGYT